MTNNANDLRRDLRFELRHYLWAGSWYWSYVCEGRLGAVQFHVSESTHEAFGSKHHGGFEVHRAIPNEHDGPPDHARCDALSDRACWHDGSSTYASEFWVPHWEIDRNDHIKIFRLLSVEYRKRFETEEDL